MSRLASLTVRPDLSLLLALPLFPSLSLSNFLPLPQGKQTLFSITLAGKTAARVALINFSTVFALLLCGPPFWAALPPLSLSLSPTHAINAA